MTFHDWLTGNAGTPGEYMYTSIHWWTLACVGAAAVLVLLPVLLQPESKKMQRHILVAVSIFQLGFEILWRLVYLLVKGDSILSWWPMYPCNLGGILIPLAALLRIANMKKKCFTCSDLWAAY